MKCMEPVVIYWNSLDKCYSYKKPRNFDMEKSIVVNCGRCPACRAEWRTQLAQRMRYELQNYSYNEKCFITLTVDNAHMDEVFPNHSLNHSYFQKFIKRLRRYLEYNRISHKPLKYLVSGEYGKHNTHRPHFHLILLGWKPDGKDDVKVNLDRSKKGYQTFSSKIVTKLWGAGIVDIGDVTEHTAPYMVKYICKHSEERKKREIFVPSEFEFIDEDTGEIKTFKGKTKVKINCFKNLTPVRNKKGEYIKDENNNFVYEVREVRAPYVVYPKKILGIDFFLDNYKQILRNGFIHDSNGKRHGIPNSFLKYCKKHEENIELNECYQAYLDRIQLLFEEEKQRLISLGYVTFSDRVLYYREQGRIKRIEYECFKNKNR